MGTIYQVSQGCTKGTDLEHFRIEGLTLEKNQRVVLYYNATDTSGRTVKSSVSVTIVSNGNLHFIAWQDKNCDQSYSGNVGTTIANDKTMAKKKTLLSECF